MLIKHYHYRKSEHRIESIVSVIDTYHVLPHTSDVKFEI